MKLKINYIQKGHFGQRGGGGEGWGRDINSSNMLVESKTPNGTQQGISDTVLRFSGRTLGSLRLILGTVKTLNIGTPRPATIVVLNIKQFNFTRK